MKRRHLLASVALTMGPGCSELLAEETARARTDEPSATPTARPTATVADDALRYVTVTSTDEEPATLRAEVSIERQNVTRAQPCAISISLVNTSDSTLTVRYTGVSLFSNVRSRTGGWVLLPTPNTAEKTEPDCWVDDRRNRRHDNVEEKAIGPGASLDDAVELWSTAAGEDCMPTGDHRFVHADYRARFTDGREEAFDLAFTLDASEP
jgi:hypothetical protein